MGSFSFFCTESIDDCSFRVLSSQLVSARLKKMYFYSKFGHNWFGFDRNWLDQPNRALCSQAAGLLLVPRMFKSRMRGLDILTFCFFDARLMWDVSSKSPAFVTSTIAWLGSSKGCPLMAYYLQCWHYNSNSFLILLGCVRHAVSCSTAMLQKLIDVQLGALWAQWGGGGERGGNCALRIFFAVKTLSTVSIQLHRIWVGNQSYQCPKCCLWNIS